MAPLLEDAWLLERDKAPAQNSDWEQDKAPAQNSDWEQDKAPSQNSDWDANFKELEFYKQEHGDMHVSKVSVIPYRYPRDC